MQVHKPWLTGEEVTSALHRLWTVGKRMFDQGKYAQAISIQDLLKQLLQSPGMPGNHHEDVSPGEIQLIIVPSEEMGIGEDGLPQAFTGPQQQSQINDKIEDFSQRLQMSNGSRIKQLIEKLSNTGYGKQAQELLKLADVEEEFCEECQTYYLQDIGEHKRGCPNCAQMDAKEPWGTGKRPPIGRMFDKWKRRPKKRPPEDPLLPKNAATDDHGGKPDKVVEIADAIRRDNPDTSDESAYRMAWETYCSYTNPEHSGCTEKGKSKRKSPKPY